MTVSGGFQRALSWAKPIQGVIRRLDTLPEKQQQEIMYWVGGLAPLATNVVTPIVTHYRLKQSDLSPEERRFNDIQEISRQIVSGMLQVASFFGGAWLFGKAGGTQSNRLVEFLGGVFCAFIAYAFIRPLLSTEIILRKLYPESGQLNRPALDSRAQRPASPQELRFSQYLNRVQTARQTTQLL